jgi:homeobox protein cut-like
MDRDALQAKLQKWSDYNEIKRELEMLRAIEFASVEDVEAEDTSENGHASESLEKLLVARNKKLSDELTELRVSHKELQQRLEQLQEDLSSANMELEKTQQLNATLENDLQKTQQEASNVFETMSVAGTHTTRYPRSQYGGRRTRGASPTSSIIGGAEPGNGSESPRQTLESLRAGEAIGGQGILPMVTAQRDRFKKKIVELEQELQKQYQTVSSLRSEIASLQRDNLNLYEKTRYVSTYNRTATSGASYGGNGNPSAIQVSASDTPSGISLDRYRSAYEANISPFQAFRGRENARALKRMSLPERAIFQVTRMVLATRASRNLFALYCMALHLLVFVMLYWMGTADTAAHASSLSTSSLAEQAAAVAAAGGAEDHGDWKAQKFDAAG